jgi:hypothetical protein
VVQRGPGIGRPLRRLGSLPLEELDRLLQVVRQDNWGRRLADPGQSTTNARVAGVE